MIFVVAHSPSSLGDGAALLVSGDAPDRLAFVTVREAAQVLGCTGEAIRYAARTGKLRANRIGHGPKAPYRIESAALAEYLRETNRPIVEQR